MKAKNNRGFTMIEILGAIIIMGVLLLIAVPSVSKLMENFRKNYYKELEETLIASAKEYYSDNRIYRPNELLYSSTTSIQSLINKKYVENLKDYKGKSCSLKEEESYIIVIYRGKDDYYYDACIKCDGDDYSSDREGTYCDSAWRANDNIKYSFSDSDDFYIYHESSREEVREKLLRNLKIVKYNTKGETLDSVALAESDKENVLPVNINELDTSVENEYPLVYKKGDMEETLNVVVYKHKAPLVELKNSDGSDYTSGKWTNKLIVKLYKNDNYFELSNTSIANYQWYVDGKWQNIDCQMQTNDTCSFTIKENVNKNYKFRLVTSEGKISYVSDEYLIKVDVDKPTINISPNGSNPIVYVGNTTGKIEFNLTTNDKGGSLIKTRKYAISTSSTTVPSTFTNFYNDNLNVSENRDGNTYYVWAQVVDNAGNVSIGVWPSKEFRMKYEIKYDANGGTGAPNMQYKIHGEDLTLSSSNPTKVGYTFAGWATTSNASIPEYLTSGKYRDNKSTTLYAVWTENVLTVNYYSNYATSSFSDADNTVGSGKNVHVRTTTHKYSEAQPDGLWNYSTVGDSTYLDRTGYTATGNWGTKTIGGNLVNQSKAFDSGQDLAQALGVDLSNGNKTVNIYPQWTENVLTVNYYSNNATVSFSESLNQVGAGNNVLVRTTTHKYSESQPDGLWNYSTAGSSTYLARTGYTATGNWGTSTSGGKLVNENTGYSSGEELAKALGTTLKNGSVTVNIYPQWTTKTYTVTYDANGGSVSPSTTTVTYNSIYGTLPTPTRNGYTFNGWYLNGTKITSSSTVTTTSNHTLVASWSVSYPSVTVGNSYTVCPDDRETHTEAECFTNTYTKNTYNRFGVSNISYSNGVVSFNWSATMNSYSTTWVGSCQQRRVCVVKKGSNTCVGNWYYDFNAGTSSSWLSAGSSIGGSGSVTVDNSWAKGDYRLIVKNNSTCASSNERTQKFAFDSIFDKSGYSYSSFKLFTIN